MEIKEYQNIIATTAKYPQEVNNFGIAYTVFGLFDELAELNDELEVPEITKHKVISKAGDVLWYICALCNELNISFEEVLNISFEEVLNIEKEEASPLRLFGLVKKFYRDAKPLDLIEIKNILVMFKLAVKDILSSVNSTIPEALAANFNKLTERHATGTIQGDGETVEERKG